MTIRPTLPASRSARRRFTPLSTVLLVAGSLLAGCAGQALGPAVGWYGSHGGVAPAGERIYVCHAFGCARKTAFDFTPQRLATMKRILAAGDASAKAERAAVARLIAWSEKEIGPVVGSNGDVGGYDLHNAGVPGQMDCIDEATNTTSVLLIAARKGFLKHHRVTSPVARGFFLDGRYPHATAVLRDTESGSAWAIDSWPEANGKPPLVQPLDVWFAARS